MITSRLRASVLLLGASVGIGACSFTDPNERVGLWHPRGINDANLAAMVADPRDLVQGKRAPFSDGTLAAAAVERLYRDKVKALPDTGLVLAGVGNGAGGAGAAAAGGDSTP